ncbi:MAG: orotate phosphoribosyltransferase [Betaproteobacteria bacterium]|nr:orotate phosphoribosyltransferase [Betaproteobacteria bacterium]MDE2211269.1 orotate phosphoribosyltransferase [Betaproteobacteria bacterium]
MKDFHARFIAFAIEHQVIRFGSFKTKAGRVSPYFFNAGLFNTGASLHALSEFYADAILASGISFDFLFGPAYKGIPLAAAIAIALAQRGRDTPFCFNRKETKDHGEGGALVGANPVGRALIVDDVISAGTSVRESVALLQAAGATPVGVVTALDRMERGSTPLSAAQEVTAHFGMPVFSIATLDHLMDYLAQDPALAGERQRMAEYRARYGEGISSSAD